MDLAKIRVDGETLLCCVMSIRHLLYDKRFFFYRQMLIISNNLLEGGGNVGSRG